MSDIRPFGPSQAAELTDVTQKRLNTVRARSALLGLEARWDGDAIFIGRRRFDGIEAAEDWLDRVADE